MHKIYFQTHGCSNNFAESEIMMGLLDKADFIITDDIEISEIIVINICTVKGEFVALREIRHIVERFPKKKLIIAGCLTAEVICEIREVTEDASLINTHNITKIVQVVEEVINGNIIEAVSDSRERKTCLPRVRKNPVVGIIPILSGCNNECAYCSVRLIKGKLDSYPEEDILKEVNCALQSGCKEIWITSQDNAAYGTEEVWRSALPELLRKVLALPQDFMLRLGMMNIQNLRPIIEDIISLYKNEKMFKFLHVPLQSGSDFVLKNMNRSYTLDDFKATIARVRKEIPAITFATDIIVGFPGETEEQFLETVQAIRDLRPEVVNISRFIPRKGTKAFSMEGQIQDDEIKRRSRIVTDTFRNLVTIKNEDWHNWIGEILIDEVGKDNTWIGRNDTYKQVIVKGNYKLGQMIRVIINRTTTFDLRAEEVK